MPGALNSSDWVVDSKGKVISRGVTSCAGMLLHFYWPGGLNCADCNEVVNESSHTGSSCRYVDWALLPLSTRV